MKKKSGPFNLNRETLRALQPSALPGIAAGETGSNPHSACQTCTIGCPTERLTPQ